jgi:hypothetical protein
MDELERRMHLKAGELFGQEPTCGKKQDFKTEETAAKVAPKLSAKFEHEMEAYPCFFCGGWHVGRTMEDHERLRVLLIIMEEDS